ncbi:hypothetical protein Vqi01_42570 [Micromonospora qiuiae]|uniref:WXG100 family type VII secretion target n=1 Tax=Micromonospora qiuiae TaxID=502268 RepID=A0ABQ4JFJ0_9ACTN|nr:hypothetical protein [Micromonospora qiuiae]GIJ29095.1 hypothetical protein Vqi01_42570 [Micromonospora qiuiae]
MTDHPENRSERLRAAVASGDPLEVEAVAAVWSTLTEVTAQLALDLGQEMEDLAVDWTGSDSERYRASIFKIEKSCRAISEGAHSAREALDMMAKRLREVKEAIEQNHHEPDFRSLATELRPASVLGRQHSYVPDDATLQAARLKATRLLAELDDWLQVRGASIQMPRGYRDTSDPLWYTDGATSGRVPRQGAGAWPAQPKRQLDAWRGDRPARRYPGLINNDGPDDEPSDVY